MHYFLTKASNGFNSVELIEANTKISNFWTRRSVTSDQNVALEDVEASTFSSYESKPSKNIVSIIT